MLLAASLMLQVHGFVTPTHSLAVTRGIETSSHQGMLRVNSGQAGQQLMRLSGGGVRLPRIFTTGLLNSLKMAGGVATSAAIIGTINLIGFAITITTNTHKVTDLLGTGAFAVSAMATFLLGVGGQRVAISTACVSLWSVRLAGFLFYRILKTKTDDRLSKVFKTRLEAAGFWTASALWGLLCLLPHSLLSFAPDQPCIGLFGAFAILLWGAGFGLESVADWQKWSFKQTPEGQRSWCQQGVWSISRHPNYCGEIMVWIANFALAAPALAKGGLASGSRDLLLAALSPLFTALLLTKVSGVPLAEAKSDKSFGHLPQYKAYKQSTPALFPNFSSLVKQLQAIFRG